MLVRGHWVVIRIMIADGHDVVHVGLQKLVETQPNWTLVAVATDSIEAALRAGETKPDIIIIDYALPPANGVDVIRQIRRLSPETEILIFTVHDNEAIVRELLHLGVRGYLLKSDTHSQLIAAIEALSVHRPYLTKKMSSGLLSTALPPNSYKSALTPREEQVARLIAEGLTNKGMARFLGISLKTIETHRASIMRKLSLSSQAALVRYAVRNKLIEP
jgi:DNA-binding NarL/FixJ family response regulator